MKGKIMDCFNPHHASMEEALIVRDKEVIRLIDERDSAEEAISQVYYLVVGESPEWSNLFGHTQAIEEIDETFNLLKTAVKQYQAQAAAMREALGPFAEIARWLLSSEENDRTIILNTWINANSSATGACFGRLDRQDLIKAQSALSADAGKNVLKVVEAAKVFAEFNASVPPYEAEFCRSYSVPVKNMINLRQALAAIE